jgi:phospholipid/cholesterol/gamma-HCH transport system ATP-binding protein
MAEEKDADEREAEFAAGASVAPLGPIPLQLRPSNGQPRAAERPPGQWCRENRVTAPPGSFQ